MSNDKQEYDSSTWGGYLDNNREDIQEVIAAFKDRGCPVTMYEAAMFRELAMLRSTTTAEAEAESQDRDEGEEWKR